MVLEVYQLASSRLYHPGGIEYARDVLTKALGSEKAGCDQSLDSFSASQTLRIGAEG